MEGRFLGITEKDIFSLQFFTYGKPFTGSFQNMLYYLIKSAEEEKDVLAASVWEGPLASDKVPEEKKIRKSFTFDNEGRLDMIEWLNDMFLAEFEGKKREEL